MSTEIKLNAHEIKDFLSPSKTIYSLPDVTLNGHHKDDSIVAFNPKLKHYESLFEFINDIADTLPKRQSFYTLDFEDILWKIQEWKTCLPNVNVFYAVKANADSVLLQMLAMLGFSFDCASMSEMKMVLDAGASPSNIIFANTIKAPEELKFASEKGVELMTFDNQEELLKIHRIYTNAKLLIRIAPTVVKCSYDAYDLSEQFGCTEEETVKLLDLAHQLNLNVIGVSFHVGSLCTDSVCFTTSIEMSRRVFDAASDIGFSFSILDIGGGFFGSSGTQDIFCEMADSINKALAEQFSTQQVRIIAEPGCYIVASACNLVCTILGRRCFDNASEDQPKRHYYLNDSVFSSFNLNFQPYGDQNPTPILNQMDLHSRPEYQSRLYGQTCSSTDVIKRRLILPDLKIGDRMMWCNVGAYKLRACSTFCGIPLPAPRYVFVNKNRLDASSAVILKSVFSFLKKHVSFVGYTNEDISASLPLY